MTMKVKRMVVVLAMVMACCVGMSAQDIIVKRNSEKIEAVILEVSDGEIKYKKFNYQDGPTFVIKTAEIVTIIYGNGDVQTFVEEQPKHETINVLYPLYMSDYYERVQCMASLNVNYTATHAGPGLDFVCGSRIKDFVFVGCGFGLHTLLNEPEKDYNIITAYYTDVIGYIPVRQDFMPFIDLGLGLHLSVLSLPESVLFVGLYAHVGAGFECKRFNFSMGYEFNVVDNGYFKIGVNF